jgi:hypothetical protein
MADKSKELTTTVKLENDRLLFEGIVATGLLCVKRFENEP